MLYTETYYIICMHLYPPVIGQVTDGQSVNIRGGGFARLVRVNGVISWVTPAAGQPPGRYDQAAAFSRGSLWRKGHIPKHNPSSTQIRPKSRPETVAHRPMLLVLSMSSKKQKNKEVVSHSSFCPRVKRKCQV